MKHSTHLGSINIFMRKLLKLQLWTYAILLIGGLFGCAKPPVYLTPIVDRPNMDKVYFEGRALALSFGEKSSVALTASIDEDELILLMLCISHTDRIDVIPENIRILGYGTDNQGVAVQVYPPAEYMAKKRNAQNWSLALQALAGALDAQQAGRSTSTTHGRYGGRSFVVETETKDRDAVDEALEKQREKLRQTAKNYARINAATESGLLKANTIFQNDAIGGIVIAKLLRPIRPIPSSEADITLIPVDTDTEKLISIFQGINSGTPLDREKPLSYSKIVITVPWVEEEPHQITLVR